MVSTKSGSEMDTSLGPTRMMGPGSTLERRSVTQSITARRPTIFSVQFLDLEDILSRPDDVLGTVSILCLTCVLGFKFGGVESHTVVALIPIGECGESWAGDPGQWTQEAPVERKNGNIADGRPRQKRPYRWKRKKSCHCFTRVSRPSLGGKTEGNLAIGVYREKKGSSSLIPAIQKVAVGIGM